MISLSSFEVTFLSPPEVDSLHSLTGVREFVRHFRAELICISALIILVRSSCGSRGWVFVLPIFCPSRGQDHCCHKTFLESIIPNRVSEHQRETKKFSNSASGDNPVACCELQSGAEKFSSSALGNKKGCRLHDSLVF